MPRDQTKSVGKTNKGCRYAPFARRPSLEVSTRSTASAVPEPTTSTVPAVLAPATSTASAVPIPTTSTAELVPTTTTASAVPEPSTSTATRPLPRFRLCPLAASRMSMYHAQMVQEMYETSEDEELDSDSDAETLTADEGSGSSSDSCSSHGSWSSCDSWSDSDSYGYDYSDSDSDSDSVCSHDTCDSRGIAGWRDRYGSFISFQGLPNVTDRIPELFRQLSSTTSPTNVTDQFPEALRQFCSYTGPKVVAVPIPQLEMEPMEVGVNDRVPISLLRSIYDYSTTDESGGDDCEDADDESSDESETSSYWFSNDDVEVQQACEAESVNESDVNLDEPSSGRVNQPQVDGPQYHVPHSIPSSPENAQHLQESDIQQEPQNSASENSMEFMDQDDQEPHFDQAANAALHSPLQPAIQYDAEAQHRLPAARSPIQERELNSPSPRRGILPVPERNGLNNNYLNAHTCLPRWMDRCTHCGLPGGP